jgi:transcription termination factor NusB
VVGISSDGMVVAAGHGTRLKLLELQPEGRRAMTVRDFLAGRPTPIGTLWGLTRGQTPGQTPVRPPAPVTAPARRAALQALVAIDADRADLPAAIAASRTSLVDDRDRALTATIVTGTLRWQRTLDYLIEHFAKRPLTKIDPQVLSILRLSLFQLLHLDRVPAAAVVDDAVSLTRAARKSSASGFVNAVLRSMLRQRHKLPLPPRPRDPADRDAALAYLGVTFSHPAWLVERWTTRYGFEQVEGWVQFNNDAAPLTLRANTLRVTREQLQERLSHLDVDTTATRYAPEGLVVTAGIRCAPRKTSRSSSRMKPHSSCHWRWTPAPGSGSSISAHRRGARRSQWLQPCTTRARSSPAMCERDASIFCTTPLPEAALATCTSSMCQHTDHSPSPTHSTAYSSMRRAPALAPFDAIRISDGDVPRAS